MRGQDETNEMVQSRINEHLPDGIRILGILDVVNSFHAKNHCFSRYYEYVIPSYACMTSEEFMEEKQKWDAQHNIQPKTDDEKSADNNNDNDNNNDDDAKSNFVDSDAAPANPEQVFAPVHYRVSEERLEKLNNLLGQYAGTLNYHNFTTGRTASDKSCLRHMKFFKVRKVFEHRGTVCYFQSISILSLLLPPSLTSPIFSYV
jgi:tRNA pseudouridine38-40 synthase